MGGELVVRVIGGGWYEVDADRADSVRELADELAMVADTGDDTAFGPVLATVLGLVRRHGRPLPTSTHADLVLPGEDARVSQVRWALRQP